jgi:hypothetical protein
MRSLLTFIADQEIRARPTAVHGEDSWNARPLEKLRMLGADGIPNKYTRGGK